MRFKNYITESDINIEEIQSIIEKDCKPFIDDWKRLNISKWLMSGRTVSTQFKKFSVRTDRKPKDTPIDIHNMVDDWFYKKFGIKARSNVVFVTFDPDLTEDFGELYLIFPIGQYKVISSASVVDLYMTIEDAMYDIMGSDFNIKTWSDKSYDPDGSNLKERVKEKIIKLLDKGKYTTKLSFHDNEIMLSCKEYYVVDKTYNKGLLEYFKK